MTSGCFDGERLPGPGDTLEGMHASVEPMPDPATRSVTVRAQDLACLRERSDPGRYVHGDPGEMVAADLALAAVQPGTHFEADGVDLVLIARAQWIARAGPSKEARNPSPVVSISRPWKCSSSSRTAASWASITSANADHPCSPLVPSTARCLLMRQRPSLALTRRSPSGAVQVARVEASARRVPSRGAPRAECTQP